jgi:hypothetical protein
MRRTNWLACLLLVLLVLGVGFLAPGPASAEDDLGVVSSVTELGPYRYHKYVYPSKVTAFFMYPQSYVTFDIRNGKYWMLETTYNFFRPAPRNEWRALLTFGHEFFTPEMLDVTFFTPDMKELGHVNRANINRIYSVPRDGNDYETIVVRMVCRAQDNWDVKFYLWDPVDPVIAEPIPAETFRD